MRINPKENVYGRFNVPSDQSITHRALLLGCIAKGKTYVINPSMNEETSTVISCIKKAGAKVKIKKGVIEVKPTKKIESGLRFDCGSSETLMRFLCGLVAGSGVRAELTGDKWLCQRSMRNVKEPLEAMGATVALKNYTVPPILVEGETVRPIDYVMPIGSSQVKSSLLLCALAGGVSAKITEEIPSRNHMEILMKEMGADVTFDKEESSVTLRGGEIKGKKIYVCGDFTQAMYFLTLGLLSGRVECLNTGVNPTRTGVLEILRRMGAKIKVSDGRVLCGERIADIVAEKSELKATLVTEEESYKAAAELPALACLMGMADGESIIAESEAQKAADKEYFDKIAELINSLGGNCRRFDGGIVIKGVGKYRGGSVKASENGKIAMAAVVGLSISEEGGDFEDEAALNGEYPDFLKTFRYATFAYMDEKPSDYASIVNAFILDKIKIANYVFFTKSAKERGVKKAISELKDCDGYSASEEYSADVSKKVIKYQGTSKVTKAVNVVHGVAGCSTEGEALVYSLKNDGYEVAGKSVLVIGLGSAGKNAAAAFYDAKAKVEVIGENKKAEADLKKKMDEIVSLDVVPETAAYDFIIDASDVEIDEKTIVADETMKKVSALIDVSRSGETEVITLAKNCGKPIISGDEIFFFKSYLSVCVLTEREPTIEEAAAYYTEFCERI